MSTLLEVLFQKVSVANILVRVTTNKPPCSNSSLLLDCVCDTVGLADNDHLDQN